MRFDELKPINELLNKKFKGQTLPYTKWTVKDFVIIPHEERDKRTHDRVALALDLGVSIKSIEDSIKQHPDLDIKFRLNDKEMKGCYSPQQFGLTKEFLEEYSG